MISMLFIFFSMLLLNFLVILSHPISLGMVLILYSVAIGFMVFNMIFSWFFYLLILVFLGGVMILIIYMSTLSANEKFSPYYMNYFPFFSFLFLLIFFSSSMGNTKINMSSSFMSHLYEYKNISSLLFLMIYLLITLISVVKLVKFEEGPLIKRL